MKTMKITLVALAAVGLAGCGEPTYSRVAFESFSNWNESKTEIVTMAAVTVTEVGMTRAACELSVLNSPRRDLTDVPGVSLQSKCLLDVAAQAAKHPARVVDLKAEMAK